MRKPSAQMYNPTHSLILDVDNDNWRGVFSYEELKEMKESEKPFINQLLDDIQQKLDGIEDLVRAGGKSSYLSKRLFSLFVLPKETALEWYKHVLNLHHDPVMDQDVAWMLRTMIVQAALFITNVHTANFSEEIGYTGYTAF